MTQSAGSREARRLTTAHRISHCAQRMADEQGYDGFTMEDLAVAAEVSRRTLFNYFPGKVDAVLGQSPDIAPDILDTFRGGGPHDDLVEDLAALAQAILTDKAVGREEAARQRRLLRANPRLLAAAHQRFELMSEHLVAEVLVREGPTFDAYRARVAVRVLAALFEVSLDAFVSSSDRELADLFTESLHTARQLLTS